MKAARLDDPAHIRAKRISLDGFRAFELTAADRKAARGATHIVSLKGLILDSPRMEGADMAASRLHLTGLDGRIVLKPKGDMQLLAYLPGAEATTSSAKVAAPGPTPTPVVAAKEKPKQGRYSLGKLEITGNNRVLFRDETIQPPSETDASKIQIDMGSVDTAAPNALTPVTMHALVGGYSDVNMSGTVAPFAKSPTVDLKGLVKAVDLPPFTVYSERRIGYRLKRGRLNADVMLKMGDGKMKSLTKLTVNRLELEKLSKSEQDEFTKELGLPVNTALSLLRDRNDDIKINIPVEGNLNDPRVRVGGIVRKALVGSIGLSVKPLLLPLGVTMQAGKFLIGQGRGLRFAPADFEPGQTELTADARKYLTRMAQTLADRPALRITLSGRAVPADSQVLSFSIAEDMARKDKKMGIGQKLALVVSKKKKAEKLTADQSAAANIRKEQLSRLANDRAQVVRDFLVAAGVQSNRLFASSATIETQAAAKPRVELSL